MVGRTCHCFSGIHTAICALPHIVIWWKGGHKHMGNIDMEQYCVVIRLTLLVVY